jgi:hypothetical protein
MNPIHIPKPYFPKIHLDVVPQNVSSYKKRMYVYGITVNLREIQNLTAVSVKPSGMLRCVAR